MATIIRFALPSAKAKKLHLEQKVDIRVKGKVLYLSTEVEGRAQVEVEAAKITINPANAFTDLAEDEG